LLTHSVVLLQYIIANLIICFDNVLVMRVKECVGAEEFSGNTIPDNFVIVKKYS